MELCRPVLGIYVEWTNDPGGSFTTRFFFINAPSLFLANTMTSLVTCHPLSWIVATIGALTSDAYKEAIG
jgi:hypothetical protein